MVLQKTHQKSSKLAKRVLKEIENLKGHELYVSMKFAIHLNMLQKLVRARYLENDTDSEHVKLRSKFLRHRKAALEICNRNIELTINEFALIGLRSAASFNEDFSEELPDFYGTRTSMELTEIEFIRYLVDEAIEYRFLILKRSGRFYDDNYDDYNGYEASQFI